MQILSPESPVSKLCYNHKNTEQIAFGCLNGIVGLWDTRESGKKSALLSEPEISHYEPIKDLMWLSSKGGNEFLTTSTDGSIKWWDIRNFSQTTDLIQIKETQNDNKNLIIGGTCLEYVAEYGPKYLIGTELGSIVLVTKKPKK